MYIAVCSRCGSGIEIGTEIRILWLRRHSLSDMGVFICRGMTRYAGGHKGPLDEKLYHFPACDPMRADVSRRYRRQLREINADAS